MSNDPTSLDAEALKACPFCGNGDIQPLASDTPPYRLLQCIGCGASVSEKVWNRRAKADENGGWREIESAPLDGTLVDLWLEEKTGERFRFPQCLCRAGFWYSNFAPLGQSCPLEGNPVYWMPIPPPPAHKVKPE